MAESFLPVLFVFFYVCNFHVRTSITTRVNCDVGNQVSSTKNNNCVHCHFHLSSSLLACEVRGRNHCSPLYHHSPTEHNMLSLATLNVLSVFLISASADPAPGRIPKVYNALITSNQNLEPSKAYPVYQPVLHDAFGFPYQPTFLYRGDLVGNGIQPQPASPPKGPQEPKEPPAASDSPKESSESTTEAAAKTPESEKPEASSNEAKPAQPVPPSTESPILLNAFGLPSQVLPLGHIDPVYNALPQFNPFAYHYPGLRFYDPYDPFGFSVPSIYRPLPNVLGPSIHAAYPLPSANKKPDDTPAPSGSSDQPPPSEPNDLNILNYSSKDPAIPNVPPPPLPQGGLKSDKSE